MDDAEQAQPALRADLAQVHAELADLRADVKDLLDARNTATGVVRLVKWLSTFATALAVLSRANPLRNKSMASATAENPSVRPASPAGKD